MRGSRPDWEEWEGHRVGGVVGGGGRGEGGRGWGRGAVRKGKRGRSEIGASQGGIGQPGREADRTWSSTVYFQDAPYVPALAGPSLSVLPRLLQSQVLIRQAAPHAFSAATLVLSLIHI